jgi:hypothetical protein
VGERRLEIPPTGYCVWRQQSAKGERMESTTRSGRDPDERGLVAYLLLPRPGDITKGFIVPTAFVLGAAITNARVDGHSVARAFVVWIALEYLIYQARYQWNDIRGFAADQRHPDRVTRRRLPPPTEQVRRPVAVSVAVLSTRLALTGLAAVCFASLRVGGMLLVAASGVFGVAAAYELIRTAASRSTKTSLPCPTPAIVALWIISGAGYAVRGLIGLELGAEPHYLSSRAVALAGAAFWAGGVLFVTGRWSVESIPFASWQPDGTLAWSAAPEQQRGHTIALSRWIPKADRGTVPADLAQWRPLRQRCGWRAPWNVALVICLAAAWAAGLAMSGAPLTYPTTVLVIAGALVAATIVSRWPTRFVAVVVAAVVLAVTRWSLDARWVAGLPVAAAVALYMACIGQRFAAIGTITRRLADVRRRALPPSRARNASKVSSA